MKNIKNVFNYIPILNPRNQIYLSHRDDQINEKNVNYEELCEKKASEMHLDQEKCVKLPNSMSQHKELLNRDINDENNMSADAFSNTNHDSSVFTFSYVKTSNENVESDFDCFTGKYISNQNIYIFSYHI